MWHPYRFKNNWKEKKWKSFLFVLSRGWHVLRLSAGHPPPTAADSPNEDETDRLIFDGLPIAVHLSTFLSMCCFLGVKDDLLQGSHEPKGGFGWLSWDGDQGASWLSAELNDLTLYATAFHDATDFNDIELEVDDWISSLAGAINSNDVREAMEKLLTKTVLLPIYVDIAGAGKNGRYRFLGFGRFTIVDFELPQGQQKGFINGTFLDWVGVESCQ